MEPIAHEHPCGIEFDSCLDPEASCLQYLRTTTRMGSGISNREYNGGDPRGNDGVCTWRGTANVAAGFQGDDERATARLGTCLTQCNNFSVIETSTAVMTLPHDGTIR